MKHDISIHALHEESDESVTISNGSQGIFQSTLSMRRATQISLSNPFKHDFNPRSP